ncbi:DMT family transporter [Tamlana fucoidanivorans]|uniref:DMT family transporter n=1 Tax=Allotamlana fucoidanivorans TaxID=2583814 RepID=A0A5C4SM20_9FLAO|nr:DMT family transporter [Tamlana fucoidanivorans]TNJ44551.1 DMT family transporter [Tamlana fucoidanivorans]
MQTKTGFWYGVVLGVLGVVLFSSKAVMVKLAYNYGADAVSILLFRMLFAFPFYVIIALYYKNKNTVIRLQRRDYFWLFVFGFIGYYLASYFDFIGLTYIKASLERIILFVYPTLVLFFNKLIFKQRISKTQIMAILLTYFGVVIAFWEEVGEVGIQVLLGGGFILLSAITYASYLVGSGWLIPKFGVVKFTAYAMMVSCVCVFVHYSLVSQTDFFCFSWQVYVLGLLIAVFATVIPSFLISASIKRISSSNFAIVAGIGPISTIVLAVIFLGEVLTWVQLIGALVVIVGILVVSLKKG